MANDFDGVISRLAEIRKAEPNRRQAEDEKKAALAAAWYKLNREILDVLKVVNEEVRAAGIGFELQPAGIQTYVNLVKDGRKVETAYLLISMGEPGKAIADVAGSVGGSKTVPILSATEIRPLLVEVATIGIEPE